MNGPEQIELDIANVLTEELGEHALQEAELREIAPKVEALIEQIEQERLAKRAHHWRDLPYDNAMVAQVTELAEQLGKSARNLVVLGIGGSALGTIALNTALMPPFYDLLSHDRRGGPRLFVMDNVDPVQFQALLDLLGDELSETVFNVVSKSGSTTETAAQFMIVHELLRERLGQDSLSEHFVTTTDPDNGALRAIAGAYDYPNLPIPPEVGGRFSVLSPVGLYPACCRGINVHELLEGAHDMDDPVKNTSLDDNPAAKIAIIHYLYDQRQIGPARRKSISVMMPYACPLKDLADWFRQLWAESLGKRTSAGDRRGVCIGLTPIKALGVTDQHSQVQLYLEGPNDKVITFLEVDRFERDVSIPDAFPELKAFAYLARNTLGKLLHVEKCATEEALVGAGRPCLTVRFPSISERTVGQFIYLYEAATVIAGRLFGIDPYDQPGVAVVRDRIPELL